MIRATKVRKVYGGVAVVDDVSFRIEPGESVALWGSNGAGKTTLIRCILGLIRSGGSVTVGGVDVRRRGRRVRAMIGYVPQELAFHDDIRVSSAMVFFAKLRGVGPSVCAERLGRVGLSGHESKRVRDLSGGMKQRLALAVALLSDPPVIILDEPTSNLDAAGRAEVADTLQSLRGEGKTVLFSSHRPGEVSGLADRVLVMERGVLTRDTVPEKFWAVGAGARTLRVFVSGVTEQDAAEHLRRAGHSVHLNGSGLCVAVRADHKADPLRTLAAAQVEVRDFELLDQPAQKEDTL